MQRRSSKTLILPAPARHASRLVLVLILASGSSAFGQPPLSLNDDTGPVDTAPFTAFLRDADGSLSLHDVLDASFEPLSSPVDFGYTSDKFWLRFSVSNRSSADIGRLFTTNARFMRPLEVYLLRGDGRIEQLLANDQFDTFAARPMPELRYLAAPFSLAAGEAASIYYRLGAGGRVSMAVELAPEETVLAEQHRAELASILFVSILLTLVLVNLFHFIAVRRFAYLGYVLYEFFNALYVTHIEGFTWQYLWPGLPAMNANATPVIASSGIFVGCLFAVSFLETWRYSRWAHNSLVGLMGVASIVFILSLFDSRAGNQASAALLPIAMGLSVIAAIVALRKGSYSARYFLVAWSIYFVAALLYSLSTFGLLPNTHYLGVLWLYKICIVIQAIVFSMGLADQVRRLNQEHRGTLVNLAKNLEQRLVESRERLRLERENEISRQALARKSQMLAATGHDLNQPLQTLRYSIDELIGKDTERKTAMAIRSTLAHLESVIADSLSQASADLAEVTVGNKLQSIVLGEFFRDVCNTFDATVKTNDIDLRYFRSSIVVVTYPLPLRRCLTNLLTNAIEHSESGAILLGVRYRGNVAQVEVRDLGRGIDEKLIESLSQPWNRLPDSPGSGLGLSIVTSICEQYGWSLKIESQLGVGTVVKLAVPVRQS